MRRPARMLIVGAALAACAGCRSRESGDSSGSAPAPSASPALRSDAGPPLGSPRAGMAWIPPGTLRAGTPPGRTPRVAEEELPGVPLPMGGFYMDLFPYPNEPGAIPTTNVARADAE